MISLVAGLGNPGAQYCSTRHNAGFWMVEYLAQTFAQSFSEKKKLYAQVSDIDTALGKLVLAKPHTFMNKSGSSVQALASWHKLKPEQLLIVHDELDLPAGTARFKIGGGHGGHNGLRDIIRCLGTGDFIRLRIGIGHPGDKNKVLKYVLQQPSIDDKAMIDNAIVRAINLIDDWQQGNWPKAMQELHSQPQASSS